MPDATEFVTREAMLFEAGSYPDRNIDVTEADLDTIAADPAEVPIQVGHKEPGFKLGYVRNLNRRGRELWGTLHLHPEANALVERNGIRSLSIGLPRHKLRLKEVSITGTPYIGGAALFSDAEQVVFSLGEHFDTAESEPAARFAGSEESEGEAEFKGGHPAGTGGHFITVGGHPVYISNKPVTGAHVTGALKAHGVGRIGSNAVKRAYVQGKIQTDEHLYKSIAHIKSRASEPKGQNEPPSEAEQKAEREHAAAGIAKHAQGNGEVPSDAHAVIKPPESAEAKAARTERIMGKLPHVDAAIPKLRASIAADLQKAGLTRERVGAVVAHIMDSTTMRVGSEEYATKSKRGEAVEGSQDSFGASSMRKSHVSISGDTVTFKFPGKSKKDWERSITDPHLARAVAELMQLPGERLMQHFGEAGTLHSFTEVHARDYMAPHGITPKQLRTYHGTRTAHEFLANLPAPQTAREAEENVTKAVEHTSNLLGNTPAMARQSYINPAVIHDYLARVKEPVTMSKPDDDAEFTGFGTGGFSAYLKRLQQRAEDGKIPEGSAFPEDEGKEPADDEAGLPDEPPDKAHQKPHTENKGRSEFASALCFEQARVSGAGEGTGMKSIKQIYTELVARLHGKEVLTQQEAADFTKDIEAVKDTETIDFTALQEQMNKERAALAKLRAEKLAGDAAVWADAEIAAGRAVTAERPSMIVAFSTAASDDLGDDAPITFSDNGTAQSVSRVELLKRLYANRTAHTFFEEMVKEGDIAALFNKLQTARADEEKPMDDKRRAELLAKTPLGSTILAERKAGSNGK